MVLSLCYLWAGQSCSVLYKVEDPEWRDHFQLLIDVGKKPRVIYHAELVNTEARSLKPVSTAHAAPN